MKRTVKKMPVTKQTVPPETSEVLALGQEVVDVAVLPLPVIDALIVVDVCYAIDDTAMHGH